ncbi:MAG: hypothetical protein FD137_637 [Spirochaetes bacterium]|nr:MAG: hypothetical protein FD137_637 [Spirochaetota bacterium]
MIHTPKDKPKSRPRSEGGMGLLKAVGLRDSRSRHRYGIDANYGDFLEKCGDRGGFLAQKPFQ